MEGRPSFATREEAIAFLREKGIWEKVMNAENSLRYIHTGFIKVYHLVPNASKTALAIESTEWDLHDTQQLAFILLDRQTDDCTWFYEGTREYAALMMVLARYGETACHVVWK